MGRYQGLKDLRFGPNADIRNKGCHKTSSIRSGQDLDLAGIFPVAIQGWG